MYKFILKMEKTKVVFIIFIAFKILEFANFKKHGINEKKICLHIILQNSTNRVGLKI